MDQRRLIILQFLSQEEVLLLFGNFWVNNLILTSVTYPADPRLKLLDKRVRVQRLWGGDTGSDGYGSGNHT